MNERAVSLLQQMLDEQKKQTGLLEQIATQNLALIEALADDQGTDLDDEARTYLDGTPCL
ncbi:YebO family protein [Pseudomonas sp. VEM90]